MNNIKFIMDYVWIYEHFLGMVMRDINPKYWELFPLECHYVIERHICTIGVVHV